MRVKDLLNELTFQLPINQAYNSDSWYLLVKNDIQRSLRTWYGRREILDIFEDDLQEIDAAIDLCLLSNQWKYRHLYSIYAAEYNPIWNYDGTEERTITRQLNEDKTGADTISITGTDTVTASGTDSTTTSGSYKDQADGSLQNSRTTFDDDTSLDTDKATDSRSNERTYDDLTDSTTYGRSDETEYGKETTTEYDSGRDVSEEIHDRMVRGGNQGTTTTQAMMEEELAVAGKLHLLETVVIDIINSICYS